MVQEHPAGPWAICPGLFR